MPLVFVCFGLFSEEDENTVMFPDGFCLSSMLAVHSKMLAVHS